MASAILIVPAISSAGSLEIDSFAFDSTKAWFGSSGWTYTATAATAGGATPSASSSVSGTVKITFKYTGSATDTPPTSINLLYSGKLSGSAAYSFFGRTPPSGSGSSDFSGTVTDTTTVGPPPGISGSIGPVSQSTTTASGSIEIEWPFQNQTISTSSGWSQAPSGPTTIVYTREIVFQAFSGSVGASCSVNWKGSNTTSSWRYGITDADDISIGP